jgi:hypothetical protein
VSGAWRWWLVAVAVVGLLGVGLPMQLLSSRLPEPIAVHWGADFQPNGSRPQRSAVVPPLVIVAGALLLSLVGAARAFVAGRAGRIAVVTFGSGLAAATNATIIARNLDKAVWSDADPQTAALLALQFGAAFAAAALAYAVAWRVWRDVRLLAPQKGPTLPLAEGARAYWTGSASNRWLSGIGGYLLLEALVLWALLPQLRMLPALLALHVIVFVVLELFSRIRATVDGRGVTVRYGHLGLVTQLVGLDRIDAARAIELDALAHGGWGYRGSLHLFGKASIVVRSGAAVQLDLRGGQRLFITVDDAMTAARLINSLLEREPPTAAELTSSG